MVYFKGTHVHFNPTVSDFVSKSLDKGPFVEGAIALVTGGADGLGLEIVKKLMAKNVKVILVDIKSPSAELLESDKVFFYRCDVTDFEHVKDMYHMIKAEHGVVTILINNAGIAIISLLENTSDEDIQKVLNINYIGPYVMIQTFLPDMIYHRTGYIVNIASILGLITPARLSSYGASKAGLIGLHLSITRKLKETSGTDHIKTLLVCPGKIKTSMFRNVRTPSKILAPDVNPSNLADKILYSMENDSQYILSTPYYANIIPFLKQLSWPYLYIFKRMSGMDKVTEI